MQIDGANCTKAEVAALLRHFIGRGRMPVEIASQVTGIGARLIYAHMDPHSDRIPSVAHWHAYVRVFGPTLLNQWLLGLGLIARPIEARPVDPPAHAHNRAESTALLTRANADLRLTHTEKPALVADSLTLIENEERFLLAMQRDLIVFPGKEAA